MTAMAESKKETPAMQGTQRRSKSFVGTKLHRKGSIKSRPDNTHHAKAIEATDTQRTAYASTARLRETELRRARAFFLRHPREAYSRASLCEEFGLPINHITRIVYDLMEVGFIEVVGRAVNPRSGVSVEVVGLKEKGGGNE